MKRDGERMRRECVRLGVQRVDEHDELVLFNHSCGGTMALPIEEDPWREVQL
jgi:hypothetical protein